MPMSKASPWGLPQQHYESKFSASHPPDEILENGPGSLVTTLTHWHNTRLHLGFRYTARDRGSITCPEGKLRNRQAGLERPGLRAVRPASDPIDSTGAPEAALTGAYRVSSGLESRVAASARAAALPEAYRRSIAGLRQPIRDMISPSRVSDA